MLSKLPTSILQTPIFQTLTVLIFACLLTTPLLADDAKTKAEGLDRLAYMVGTWDVTAYDQTGKKQYSTTSEIRPILDGKALEERTTGVWDGGEWDLIMQRAYDPFQKKVRMTVLDSWLGHLDIYEGKFEGEVLHQSNLPTGTYAGAGNGDKFFFRGTQERVSDDHIILRAESSKDNGKTWQAAGRYEYVRKAQ